MLNITGFVWWLGLPDVYITPAVQTLRPGDHLKMRCIEVDGQPVLFRWSKVNGTLSSAVHTDSSGFFEIASVTAHDAGRYQCHATNQAGYSDAFAEIILAGRCYTCMSQTTYFDISRCTACAIG